MPQSRKSVTACPQLGGTDWAYIGRDEPYEIGTGYGHIAITVGDIDVTLERLASVGIEPERPPYTVREGGSRLCFVRDPDDYRIELLEAPSPS